MSISEPTNCANPECRGLSFRPIHRTSQPAAIDAVDGAPVFAHLVTYRCMSCGHTWGIRGYTSEPDFKPAAEQAAFMVTATRMRTRGW